MSANYKTNEKGTINISILLNAFLSAQLAFAPGTQINVEATGYAANCYGCTGVTSTGLVMRNNPYDYSGRRVIAVDPAFIPYGTTGTLRLNDGKQYEVVAADTGGAIRGNRVDVLVESEACAYQHIGRQGGVLTVHR